MNHVIAARFNWSGVRSAVRWREDERQTGREKEGKGERRGFVRVATRIRQSRGCTRRTVARAGAASAPPVTPSRMGTHTCGNSCGTWPDHWRFTHTVDLAAHAFAYPYGHLFVLKDENGAAVEEKPRRKRNGKQGKKERGSASVDSFSSSTWGTKKLSYNCCTPRAAPPVPPSNCNLLPHRTGRIATTTRNVRVSCVLDRPPCRLTSSGCLLWPTATEITVITRIYEGLRQPSNGLPMPWSASAARSTSTDTRFPRYSKDL